MRFHAPSVSASADGDYYQLSFGPLENGEAEDDPYDVRGPYLIVQRQFEPLLNSEWVVWRHVEHRNEELR